VNLLTVLQHTSADYLGLLEDHLEGRRIRFNYCRPFTEGVSIPNSQKVGDGIVLLGGGPWGTAGDRDLPTLAEEIKLTRACLLSNKVVIGFGVGAQILALAADGRVEKTPLSFSVDYAKRTKEGALNGYLPERFPHIVYMRDRPIPPDYADILALDSDGHPAVFQIGEKAFGFTGHPGFKRAMAEDLIMEFSEGPANPAMSIQSLGEKKHEIEDALVPIMTGLIQTTRLMQSDN